MKQHVVAYLQEKGIPYYDAGCHSTESVKYPVFGRPVAQAVSLGEAAQGILICSSGIGISMLANKFRGVRAALCTSALMAKMTRAHNNANILCLGGRMTGTWEATAILDAWFATDYEGGRHDISLGMMEEVERENFI